jgi:hypothetical protein
MFVVVLNFDLISHFELASATTEFHTMIADIESVREEGVFTPCDQ